MTFPARQRLAHACASAIVLCLLGQLSWVNGAVTSIAWSEPTSINAAPSARYGSALAATATKIYVFGGQAISRKDDFWSYTIALEGWTELSAISPKPSARDQHAMVAYNNDVYLFSGQGDEVNQPDFVYYQDFWRFNTGSNTWTDLSVPSFGSLPSGRSQHSMCVMGDKMYVYGGWDGGSSNGFFEYRFSSNAWFDRTASDSAGGATYPWYRRNHVMAGWDNKLYIHGGYVYPDTTAELWEYDTASSTWTDKSNTASGTPPSEREQHGMVVMDGHLVVFGGQNDAGSVLSDVFAYHIASGTWSNLDSVSSGSFAARDEFALGAEGGSVFVFGCDSSFSCSGGDFLRADVSIDGSTPAPSTPPSGSGGSDSVTAEDTGDPISTPAATGDASTSGDTGDAATPGMPGDGGDGTQPQTTAAPKEEPDTSAEDDGEASTDMPLEMAVGGAAAGLAVVFGVGMCCYCRSRRRKSSAVAPARSKAEPETQSTRTKQAQAHLQAVKPPPAAPPEIKVIAAAWDRAGGPSAPGTETQGAGGAGECGIPRVAGDKRWHCFLSHDWGRDEAERDNHARVARLNEYLKARGVQTWFDSEQMAHNIQDKMCDGIEQSEVFVACITRKYHDKVQRGGDHDNCRKEFQYAARRKGASMMVPVVMEKGMKDTKQWSGPLGMELGNELWKPLWSDEAFEAQAEGVLQSVLQNLTQRTQA